MSKFKVGDIVRVVRGGYGIHPDDTGCKVQITGVGFGQYLHNEDCYKFKFVDGQNSTYNYYEDSWSDGASYELWEEPVVVDELVEEEPEKRMLTLQLGTGIGIILDPNVPFSRKFADAFLNAIYGDPLA